MRCYPHFTLTRGRSPGFGSMSTNYSPYSDSLSLRLRLSRLNLARTHHSPVHSTKGTPSHLSMLRLLVGTRFQVLFHSAPAVLFTFPSRYSSLSVAREYLALGGGPPRFPRGFSCPAVLGVKLTEPSRLRRRGCHPLWPAFPDRLADHLVSYSAAVLQDDPRLPRYPELATAATLHKLGLGSSAFARHYLRNHFCFLLLEVLRCFSSLGCLHTPMDSVCSNSP